LIKKWLSNLLAGASLSTSASPQQTYAVGNTSIMLPAGWQLVESSEDKLVFRTKDNDQHATITVMHFGVSANFEDFKLLCEARFKAERMAITDGYIEPDTPAPVKDGDTFWMFYSGGERTNPGVGYLLSAPKSSTVNIGTLSFKMWRRPAASTSSHSTQPGKPLSTKRTI
jgi:hypothetical protein